MAAFKDKKNGSWYVQFRYTDWRGERQQKLKRGFATKKEAQAWEREFLMQKQADVNMSFESFVALYEKDVKPKLKLNTWLSKEHIIRTKILPYFKKRKAEVAGLKQELSEYKSVRSKLRTSDLERENAELRGKVQHYEDVIQRNNLWHFFRPRREKAAMRDDAR